MGLEDVVVAPACAPVTLAVSAGTVRAVVVPDQPAADHLTRVLLGLDEPDPDPVTGLAGRVLVDGADVARQHADHRGHRPWRLPRAARHRSGHCGVRLVPDDGGLVPELTLVDNILDAQCPSVRISRTEAVRRASVTAVTLGMSDDLDRRQEQLPPSQRRIAGLVRVLCWEPSVLVLRDAPDLPTWGAVLRGHEHRPDRPTDAPGLLDRVATVLVTTDPARARHLDDDPVRVDPGPTNGGARA